MRVVVLIAFVLLSVQTWAAEKQDIDCESISAVSAPKVEVLASSVSTEVKAEAAKAK